MRFAVSFFSGKQDDFDLISPLGFVMTEIGRAKVRLRTSSASVFTARQQTPKEAL
jgi:hypothetical protein